MQVGEINIDNNLVVENLVSAEDLVSMDRGCVCCSLRHDIVKALGELQSRGERNGVAYDNILLETTGLADPAPVAFTFFSNTWISSNFRLDSILCLVDAQHVGRHLEDGGSHGDVNEAVNQIAFADIILLNKIDLVTPEELQKARDLVRSINVTADVIEVSLKTDAPSEELPCWDRLMGINSFSIERALKVDPYFMDSDSDEEDEDTGGDGGTPKRAKRARRSSDAAAAAATAAVEEQKEREAPANPKLDVVEISPCGGHEGPCNEQCADPELDALLKEQQAADAAAAAEGGATHRQPKKRRRRLHDASGVGSVGITARGPLDKYRFNAFMRDLLSERARDIFRSKGVLCIKGQETTKFVFQGVHETVCFGPAASGWPKGDEIVNQIVFIGRSLNRKDLAEGFRSCVWVPLPDGWSEHHDLKTGQPYYVDTATGKKQWDRPPETACALVTATETSHEQPSALQPRKGSEVPAN
jgi:G3E family GTPase